MSEKLGVFLLGGDLAEIEEYRKLLHPKDARLNVIEISISPAYVWRESSSNAYSRNYSVSEAMVALNANIWASPFFGFQANYLGSIAGDIQATPDGLRNVSYATGLIDIGIRFRNFFGISRRAGSISFGLDYEESQTKVDRGATLRTGFRSSGVKFALDAVMPVSTQVAVTAGFEILPYLNHRESNSGVAAGDSNRSAAIGFSVGGRYLFDRRNQFFWKVSQRFERNLFSGPARSADPVTGQTPSGVVVNQGWTLFQVGFTWAP